MSLSEKAGPGTWFCIHTLALRAISPEGKKEYSKEIKHILTNIQCDNCRDHALEYLGKNPIERYFSLKDHTGFEIGCFAWSVNFHNSVNRRLKKKEYSVSEAKAIWTSGAAHCDQCLQAPASREVTIDGYGKKKKIISRFH